MNTATPERVTEATIDQRLRWRHDQLETYRLEHDHNPPEYPGWWHARPGYTARPYRVDYTSPDGQTVVEYAQAWRSMTHIRDNFDDPVALIATQFFARPADRFTISRVNLNSEHHGRRWVYRVTGSTEGWADGFLFWTTDRAVVVSLMWAAKKNLPEVVNLDSVNGPDPSRMSIFRREGDGHELALRLADDRHVKKVWLTKVNTMTDVWGLDKNPRLI